MKKHNCDGCHKEIEVYDEYEPEMCCNGFECGCYGHPVNPLFCDECEIAIFGRLQQDEREV